MPAPSFLRCVVALALCALLGACDMLGIESGTEVAARKESEGKAIGSACRHAMRAIEDCYTLNKKASKSAVYAGIAPVVPRTPPPKPTDGEGDATAAAADGEAADKEKSHAKPAH